MKRIAIFHEECRHVLQISEIEGSFDPNRVRELAKPFLSTPCPGCGHSIQRVGSKVEEQELKAGMRRVGILHEECRQMVFVGEVHNLQDQKEMGQFLKPFLNCICPRCGKPIQEKIALVAERDE